MISFYKHIPLNVYIVNLENLCVLFYEIIIIKSAYISKNNNFTFKKTYKLSKNLINYFL